METQRKQPKFYWHIQAYVFVLLVFTNGSFANVDGSHFSSYQGKNFFVLTDSTFSPNENALVRVEFGSDLKMIDHYGGIDVAVYKVAQPLNFLKSQKNLHRVTTNYKYEKGGVVANALSYVWDNFFKKSRLIWQRILSSEARTKATASNEQFKQVPAHSYNTEYKNYKQFKPMAGYQLLEEFRYPLTLAQPITSAAVTLAGSTHESFEVNKGNVYVPLGKLSAGLYLVEVILGDHRANTLVFVSDSVLISKVSKKEIFLWTTHKTRGVPMSGAEILVTDGVGTLHKGKTDSEGFLKLDGNSPEQMYLLGEDDKGGVFISENFYYESEIYTNKIYTFTDRPLYRPGDAVSIKVIGRDFKNSNQSALSPEATFSVMIIDSSGTVIVNDNLKFNGTTGGDFRFKLPSFALPGGYTILLKNRNQSYAAEFRVAKYSKPHFNLDIVIHGGGLKLNEKGSGQVQLAYANGSPVKKADVNIILRRQKLNVTEGDTDAESLFPVQVNELKLKSDDSGKVSFELPAVAEASRYLIFVKAQDASALTVNGTAEVANDEGRLLYEVVNPEPFAKDPKEIEFQLKAIITSSKEKPKMQWSAVRLEDQTAMKGEINSENFKINFTKPGTYRVLIQDSNGIVYGRSTQIIMGEKLQTLAGNISINTDKSDYRIGETAKIFINFSDSVDEALLTLERDRVEKHSLGNKPQNWLSVKKISPTQWEVAIPVEESFAPNMIFSVLYVKRGKVVFNNKGLKVYKPEIMVGMNFDKKDYGPGDMVNLEITTELQGKVKPSVVAIGVVDEMIYVLQPEVAPTISDFFYGRRRNQVKTSSSLSFFTYDSSISAAGRTDSNERAHTNDRPLKMKERPRREEIDTAYWGTITTDAAGKAKIKFKLPESVTRWRITARAISSDGEVGQTITKFNSNKEVYLKWGNHQNFRKGDDVTTSILAFNQEAKELSGKLVSKINGVETSQNFRLKSGVNYLPVKFKAEKDDDMLLSFVGDKNDQLATKISVMPVQWQSVGEHSLKLKMGKNIIPLPDQSFNFRLLHVGKLREKFLKAAKDLIEYPYGCVEQTASRLIPLSIAYDILRQGKEPKLQEIKEKLSQGRERLITMANSEGYYGWYQAMDNESMMTAYAYLADSYASKVLGLTPPYDQFKKVVLSYRDHGSNNVLKDAVVIWMASQLGQPVQSLVEGLFQSIKTKMAKITDSSEMAGDDDYIMDSSHRKQHYQLATLFLAITTRELQEKKLAVNEEVAKELSLQGIKFAQVFENANSYLLQSAAINYKYYNQLSDDNLQKVEGVLSKLSAAGATIDRSLSLILLNETIRKDRFLRADVGISGPWNKSKSMYDFDIWSYSGQDFKETEVELLGKQQDQDRDFKLLFDHFKVGTHDLPMKIEVKYYRLKNEGERYVATLMNDTNFDTENLFMQEVILEPSGKSFQYGLIEIPLPPGGTVEHNLSGANVVTLNAKGQPTSMRLDGQIELGSLSYGIPVKLISSKQEFRALISFSAKGNFVVPQTRFFEMYQSTKNAYAEANNPASKVMNVR